MLVSSLSKGGENEKGLGRQKEGVSGGDREGVRSGERSGDRVKRESRGNKNSSSAVSSSGVKSVKGVNELLAAEAGVGVRVSDSEVKSSGSGSGGGSGIGGRGGSGSESSVEDVEDFSFLDSRIGKNIFGGGGENGDNIVNNIVLNEIEGKSRQVDGRSVDHGNAAARLLLNAFGDPGPDSAFNSNSGNDKNIFKSVGKI